MELHNIPKKYEEVFPFLNDAIKYYLQTYNGQETFSSQALVITNESTKKAFEKTINEKNLEDPISCCLIDIPVRIHGDVYDLDGVLELLRLGGGVAVEPLQGLHKFTYADIQPARDLKKKIQKFLDKAKQAQACEVSCGDSSRQASLSSSKISTQTSRLEEASSSPSGIYSTVSSSVVPEPSVPPQSSYSGNYSHTSSYFSAGQTNANFPAPQPSAPPLWDSRNSGWGTPSLSNSTYSLSQAPEPWVPPQSSYFGDYPHATPYPVVSQTNISSTYPSNHQNNNANFPAPQPSAPPLWGSRDSGWGTPSLSNSAYSLSQAPEPWAPPQPSYSGDYRHSRLYPAVPQTNANFPSPQPSASLLWDSRDSGWGTPSLSNGTYMQETSAAFSSSSSVPQPAKAIDYSSKSISTTSTSSTHYSAYAQSGSSASTNSNVPEKQVDKASLGAHSFFPSSRAAQYSAPPLPNANEYASSSSGTSLQSSDSKRNEKGLDALIAAAKNGNAVAQSCLGGMYDEGEGVAKNYTEAVKWYRLAAAQGEARGQCNLGIMYAEGKGVPKDYIEGAKWIRLAAEQGKARSQANLGVLYLNGFGVPKNQAEAVKWYRLAVEQGDASGQCNLGVSYENGEGVAKNYAEAVKWYRLAAAQGNARGQYFLGRMYEKGQGVANTLFEVAQGYFSSSNTLEAVKWYFLASEQGDADAIRALRLYYTEGRVTKEEVQAAVEAEKKKNLGDAKGQMNDLLYSSASSASQAGLFRRSLSSGKASIASPVMDTKYLVH